VQRLWNPRAINCAARDTDLGATVSADLIDAKLALMAPLWDRAAWGPFTAFEAWARSPRDGGAVPPDGPRTLFEEVHPRC